MHIIHIHHSLHDFRINYFLQLGLKFSCNGHHHCYEIPRSPGLLDDDALLLQRLSMLDHDHLDDLLANLVSPNVHIRPFSSGNTCHKVLPLLS